MIQDLFAFLKRGGKGEELIMKVNAGYIPGIYFLFV